MNSAPAQAIPTTLRRTLGRWDLAAIGVNQIIGGGIFLMPAPIAVLIGNWSPLAFLLAGAASLCVGLCFAESGSRFLATGGAYVYTRAAFGRFVAFETGWMQWFTRVSSQAGIVNGLAAVLGFYVPALRDGWERAGLITAVTLGLGVLNGAGIRQTAWVINGLTAAKLTPLVVFVAVGVFHAEWGRLTPLPPVNWEQTAGAGLLLFFTFGGFDTVVVPAGEARDPRRDLPFALVVSIAVSTAVMMLVQAVTMATLADVAGSATPVADAAAGFLGTWGTAMVVAGSAVSMLGNNVGGALSASRVLFALGEQADLPAWFARIHPRFRTPWNSIWFSTAVALGLALAGSFAWLAATSALARLLTYLAVAAATLRFRRGDLVRVPEAAFRAPLGALVPVAAIASSCAMFVGATRVQLLAGLGALVVGAALYVLAGDGVRALRGSGRGK